MRLGLGDRARRARPRRCRRCSPRAKERPFASLADFLRRTRFSAAERRVLAGAGALNALAGHRRSALWQRRGVPRRGRPLPAGAPEADEEALSPLERMTLLERLQADYAHLSLTTGAHPMRLARPLLPDVRPAGELKDVRAGERVQDLRLGHHAPAARARRRGSASSRSRTRRGSRTRSCGPRLFEEARLVINLEPALVITGPAAEREGRDPRHGGGDHGDARPRAARCRPRTTTTENARMHRKSNAKRLA